MTRHAPRSALITQRIEEHAAALALGSNLSFASIRPQVGQDAHQASSDRGRQGPEGTVPTACRIERRIPLGQRPVEPNLRDNLATVTRRSATHPATVVAVAVATLIVGISAAVIMSRSGGDTQEVSVNAASSVCPHTEGAWRRGPQRPGTDEMFVPDTPVSATMCRYDGPRFADPRTLKLTGSTELSGGVLTNFVTALNAARKGYMRCPAPGPSSVVWAKFHYTDGPDVEVYMEVAGCWNASNGRRDAIVSGIEIPGRN